MKRVFSIRNKDANLAIQVLGKNLMVFYDHRLIRFNIAEKYMNQPYDDSFTINEIDLTNVTLCAGGASLKILTKYLNSSEKIKGYLFQEKLSKGVIGFYWLFFQGSHEWEYTVCANGESALISAIYVYEKYRGKRFMVKMIEHAFQVCRKKNINYLYASVRKNNVSAWKAYNRVGYEFIEKRKFIRLLGHNIPQQYIP